MAARKITPQQRDRLRLALERGEVTNASQFAETFAQANDLNASTVRSMLSRLRREIPPVPEVSPDLIESVMVDDDLSHVVDLAAAIVLRYNNDPEFHETVDERRRAFMEVAYRFKEARVTAKEAEVDTALLGAILDSDARVFPRDY